MARPGAAIGLDRTAELVRGHGLALSGYCRGGMFPGVDAAARQAALDDNRRAVDEAKSLDAACLVLVVGGLPGALAGKALTRDIAGAREQVREGIAMTLEHARRVGMPLAIEPLHPMYAADRACINTLEQALDVCDALDPRAAAPSVSKVTTAPPSASRWTSTTSGGTRSSRRRSPAPAASGCSHSMSATGWCRPATCSNDRGMMGDGVIDIPKIRAWVEAAGFAGYSEVEIFSSLDWWKRPADEVLATCIERHRSGGLIELGLAP